MCRKDELESDSEAIKRLNELKATENSATIAVDGLPAHCKQLLKDVDQTVAEILKRKKEKEEAEARQLDLEDDDDDEDGPAIKSQDVDDDDDDDSIPVPRKKDVAASV